MEELSSVKVTVSRHEQQLSQAAHVGVVQKDSHDSGRDEQGQSTVRADVDESGHTHMGGRRLQGSSEYAAVPAWQVHEFPSGHTCGTGARMRLQPKSASGDLTWRMSSGVDASSNQKLVNVGSQWATTDVQELATPLKVVHDASCSNAPTLNLPLSTTVQTLAVSGSLTASTLSSGAASVGSLTSSGAASVGSLTSSGAASVASLTSSGAASVGSLTVNGDPITDRRWSYLKYIARTMSGTFGRGDLNGGGEFNAGFCGSLLECAIRTMDQNPSALGASFNFANGACYGEYSGSSSVVSSSGATYSHVIFASPWP
jgi:hypothetical protein